MALSRNEIKSVEVGKEAVRPSPVPMSTETLLTNANAESLKGEKTQVLIEGLDIAEQVPAPKQAAPKAVQAAMTSSLPALESTSKSQSDGEKSPEGRQTQNQEMTGAQPDTKSERKLDNRKPVTSGRASEFMLDRMSGNSGTALEIAPAIVTASTLGEAGDRRVSAESLNLVADRIESLKARGGGTLKVELNPSDMGAIEIRVTKVGDEVQVRLTAEKPATLEALKASSADLTAKLESLAPSKLEISNVVRTAGGTSAAAPQATEARGSTTAQVMDLRASLGGRGSEASSTAMKAGEFTNVRSENLASVGAKSADLSKASSDLHVSSSSESRLGQEQGEQRQQRREEAMNSWEEESLKNRRKAS